MDSATAQIAAMEAKLAAMAKRKPADEDYVPGRGIYSGSNTASPLPEGIQDDIEMDEEEALGPEEGERAADDLEQELEAEFNNNRLEGDGQSNHDTSLAANELEANDLTEESKPDASQTFELSMSAPIPSLPARPVIPATKISIPIEDAKSKAKEEALKRGLAGLPKKPAF